MEYFLFILVVSSSVIPIISIPMVSMVVWSDIVVIIIVAVISISLTTGKFAILIFIPVVLTPRDSA